MIQRTRIEVGFLLTGIAISFGGNIIRLRKPTRGKVSYQAVNSVGDELGHRALVKKNNVKKYMDSTD